MGDRSHKKNGCPTWKGVDDFEYLLWKEEEKRSKKKVKKKAKKKDFKNVYDKDFNAFGYGAGVPESDEAPRENAFKRYFAGESNAKTRPGDDRNEYGEPLKQRALPVRIASHALENGFFTRIKPEDGTVKRSAKRVVNLATSPISVPYYVIVKPFVKALGGDKLYRDADWKKFKNGLTDEDRAKCNALKQTFEKYKEQRKALVKAYKEAKARKKEADALKKEAKQLENEVEADKGKKPGRFKRCLIGIKHFFVGGSKRQRAEKKRAKAAEILSKLKYGLKESLNSALDDGDKVEFPDEDKFSVVVEKLEEAACCAAFFEKQLGKQLVASCAEYLEKNRSDEYKNGYKNGYKVKFDAKIPKKDGDEDEEEKEIGNKNPDMEKEENVENCEYSMENEEYECSVKRACSLIPSTITVGGGLAFSYNKRLGCYDLVPPESMDQAEGGEVGNEQQVDYKPNYKALLIANVRARMGVDSTSNYNRASKKGEVEIIKINENYLSGSKNSNYYEISKRSDINNNINNNNIDNTNDIDHDIENYNENYNDIKKIDNINNSSNINDSDSYNDINKINKIKNSNISNSNSNSGGSFKYDSTALNKQYSEYSGGEGSQKTKVLKL